MSLSCWWDIGSLAITPFPTILKDFDGCSFQSYGLLPYLAITLGGNSVSILIEVVDTPLDYNLLLGRSWTYAMCEIASAVLRVVVFPHE